jgi:hypothetical protein
MDELKKRFWSSELGPSASKYGVRPYSKARPISLLDRDNSASEIASGWIRLRTNVTAKNLRIFKVGAWTCLRMSVLSLSTDLCADRTAD